jgi:hypothetical protein
LAAPASKFDEPEATRDPLFSLKASYPGMAFRHHLSDDRIFGDSQSWVNRLENIIQRDARSKDFKDKKHFVFLAGDTSGLISIGKDRSTSAPTFHYKAFIDQMTSLSKRTNTFIIYVGGPTKAVPPTPYHSLTRFEALIDELSSDVNVRLIDVLTPSFEMNVVDLPSDERKRFKRDHIVDPLQQLAVYVNVEFNK